MRLIDGDALKEKIMQSLKACEEWQNDCSALLNITDYYRAEQGVQTFQMCIAFLENQPTIEERRKGKWIVFSPPDDLHCGLVECPFCEEELIAEPNEYNFCPNCGADMRERREDGKHK